MVPAYGVYLTTGDNEKSNGCRLDHQARIAMHRINISKSGSKDQNGNPVLAVKDEVIGVVSTEIPRLGSIKLLTVLHGCSQRHGLNQHVDRGNPSGAGDL